jgi:hypothetical protein
MKIADHKSHNAHLKEHSTHSCRPFQCTYKALNNEVNGIGISSKIDNQLVIKFLALWYLVHKISPEDCTLTQLNPISNSMPYSSKIHFNITIPSIPSLPKRSLLLKFSEKYSACITYFLHVCYMSCIAYPLSLI